LTYVLSLQISLVLFDIRVFIQLEGELVRCN